MALVWLSSICLAVLPESLYIYIMAIDHKGLMTKEHPLPGSHTHIHHWISMIQRVRMLQTNIVSHLQSPTMRSDIIRNNLCEKRISISARNETTSMIRLKVFIA